MCNRVGKEVGMDFAGESLVVDGRVILEFINGMDDILFDTKKEEENERVLRYSKYKTSSFEKAN